MCGITGTEVAKEAGTCFAFMVKDEEVKRGYLHPSRAEAPWCDSVGKLVHMLSKLCLLLGDVRLVFSGFWDSSSYTAWKGTGERKKKRKMSSLYVTLVVGLCMMEHRQHGYLKHLQFHQMKRRRNVKHLPRVFQKKWKHCFRAWILPAFLYCAENRLLCPLVGRSTAAKPAVVHCSMLLSTACAVAPG